MAKLSIEELIAAFKELSLVEVSEFVKAFEEEFDVTAAAPVAVVAGGAAGEGGCWRNHHPQVIDFFSILTRAVHPSDAPPRGI